MKRIIVTGLPGQPGAVFGPTETIAAFRASADAIQLGLEGAIYLVEDDEQGGERLVPFDKATKARGAPVAEAPWSVRK